MYNYFKGTVTDKVHNTKGCFLTLEISGIGYMFEVTERDFSSLGMGDENVTVYSVLVHKEDTMYLCGFLNKQARDLFQILTSVSGVGVKMAFALLNQFDFAKLISIVIDGQYKELTLAKGVGTKLAQKIILELKDKLIKTNIEFEAVSDFRETEQIKDTRSILESLGYEHDEIQEAFSSVLSTIANPDNSEELLKATLTHLSN